uniref:Uncharacterized protein n=1 Tax=Sparus aurata TaxID=8175 RepID=A0A671YEQ7_SPAAU
MTGSPSSSAGLCMPARSPGTAGRSTEPGARSYSNMCFQTEEGSYTNTVSDGPLISCQSLFTCQSSKRFQNEPQLCCANTEDSLVWGRLRLSVTVISRCQSRQ